MVLIEWIPDTTIVLANSSLENSGKEVWIHVNFCEFEKFSKKNFTREFLLAFVNQCPCTLIKEALNESHLYNFFFFFGLNACIRKWLK